MMGEIRMLWGCVAVCFLGIELLQAQEGDKKEQNPDLLASTNWREFIKNPVPVLSAEESLKRFKVPEGFKVELVACEPMIIAPVFSEFDAEGRLWVCEMQGYMRDLDGSDEYAKQSRVMVLEDLNGDGRMDKATPFLDEVDNPRSLAHVDGGVLVVETKRLLFCQDTDGDLKADKVTVVADFAEAAHDNIEHAENGLHFALDNWMYNSKSSRRLQWQAGELKEEFTLSRGQWGFSSDVYGRLFYNSNSLWAQVDWQGLSTR